MSPAIALSATRLWRDHPRGAAAVGALAVAAIVAAAGSAYSQQASLTEEEATEASQAAPTPPPLLVRPLAAQDALSVNERIPLNSGPNPAARPFVFKGGSATRAQAVDCLASAVYYEAGSQDANGQRAVAQVVLNRVRNPAFPASICSVVYQGSTRATGCQFTFTCDGSLGRRPDPAGWALARSVAEAALSGAVYRPVGLATHYHANYVVPYWASTLVKNAVVGAHIFYRWAGGWGQPSAFVKRYAGAEPSSAALRSAALAAEARHPDVPADVATAIAAIPGAELKSAKNGQVAVRFEMARKAVEEAPREAYVEKFKASDNLRWTLGGSAPPSSEAPLGTRATGTAATGSIAATSAAPAAARASTISPN